VPGYNTGVWYSLLAPAGTPRAIIDRLHRESVAVLNRPEFNKLLVDPGNRSDRQHPEELAKYIKDELELWAKVVKEAGSGSNDSRRAWKPEISKPPMPFAETERNKPRTG